MPASIRFRDLSKDHFDLKVPPISNYDSLRSLAPVEFEDVREEYNARQVGAQSECLVKGEIL